MADEDEGENEIIDLAEPEGEGKEEPKAAKPPPVPGPTTAKPAAAKPAAPAQGLKELEQQVESERAARSRTVQENQRLQQERDQAILFAQEAERRGMSTYELYNENQITATNEQMEALAAQHESAMSDGDFKTAAQINLKLNRLGGQLAILERDKATLAEQREVMKAQHTRPLRPAQPAEPPPADPIERAIARRTEPTKQFLRKHPELIRSDGTLKRAAIDAHDNALDAGYQVDTPSYFEHIEKLISGGVPADGGAPVPRMRAPQTAGPVSRSGAGPGSVTGSDPNTFSVTPKMRRLAEEQGVPIREWVTNYVRLLKEGRITPIS